MINLIKSINEQLCKSLFPVIIIILLLGFAPGFAYYVNNIPDVPKETVKCKITTVTLEGDVKATLKNCEGTITLQENSK